MQLRVQLESAWFHTKPVPVAVDRPRFRESIVLRARTPCRCAASEPERLPTCRERHRGAAIPSAVRAPPRRSATAPSAPTPSAARGRAFGRPAGCATGWCFAAARHRSDVSHCLAFGQPRRQPGLHRREPKNLLDQIRIHTKPASAVDNQHECAMRREKKSVSPLATGFTCSTSPGTAAAGRNIIEPLAHAAAKPRQRLPQQPLEHRIVVRKACAQGTVPVANRVTIAQEVPGMVVRLHDAPAPVEMDDSGFGLVQQPGEGRAKRAGFGKRLAKPNVLTQVGKQSPDHVDPCGRPTHSRRPGH